MIDRERSSTGKARRLDTYLDLAAAVLLEERRPLSARAILASAYRSGLVPPHLYGKTQHKTLQARMSEDIVALRDHSLFFRTAPGRFFLRELLTDTTLPEDFRRPIPTRRRSRELLRGSALSIEQNALCQVSKENTRITPEKIFKILQDQQYKYNNPKEVCKQQHFTLLRSFVCVYRDSYVLTYRLGRYREDRDTFMHRRSVGFSTLIHPDEHTLFNFGDFGIVDSGLRATKIDLDIPALSHSVADESMNASYAFRVNGLRESILYQFQLIASCAVATIRRGYVL